MYKLSYSLLSVLLLSLCMNSCTKFSDNINKNPNQPDTFSNPKLLTYAIQQLTSTTETPYGLLYVQHLSEKVYTDASRYVNIRFEFSSLYANPLMNLRYILNTKRYNEEEGSVNNQKAMARILRAYYFWHITDRWGNVPYTQALSGTDNISPAYDNQQSIYTDLFKELTEAGDQLETGDNSVQGDILYYGDMSKWKKLAGTLHALMALRLSKIDPALGRQEFAKALTTGVFESNEDNAFFQHLAETAYENYWYYVYTVQGRRWYCISEALVNYMNPLGDPRLRTYAAKNSSGVFKGMPYGVEGKVAQNIAAGEVSFQSAAIRKRDAKAYIVTYAQLLFAKAEAAKLGWIGEEAAADYTAAIKASVEQWNGTDTSGLGAYLQRPAVVYNDADAIKQIAYQRWVHLYMNGYEAWAEWRRTGYPELQPAPNNGNVPIPRRQGYPSSESNINTANYQAAVQAQPGFNGKDDLNGKVWWDK